MNGRRLALLVAGFLVWTSAFIVLYAMLSVGCRFGWDDVELTPGLTLQRVQLVVIFLVHLAGAALLVLAFRQRAGVSFLHGAAFGTALAAFGSTLFSFVAVFALTTCN